MLEAETVAAQFYDLALMQDPIEYGDSDGGITKQLAPVLWTFI